MSGNKKYNSVDKTQSDIIKNQELILEVLTKIDQVINTTDSFVSVSSKDMNGNEVITQLPSVSFMNSRLDNLAKTIKKMTGFEGFPVSLLFDSNGKRMYAVDINEEPEKIVGLPEISTYSAKPNWIFDSMMNPQIMVEIDLTDKIGENTKTIISKRFVIEFETMVVITDDGFRSEVLTSTGKIRLSEFEEKYKGKSNININDFVLWLDRDGIINKTNEYLIDDDHFKIDPLNIETKGFFNIMGTEIDILNNKLWYIFESLVYYDISKGFGNETPLELKPGVELAVHNPNGTSATIYKVAEISTITSQFRVRLERVFGDEPVPVTSAGLRINSKAIKRKVVNISVGFDEYSVLFIKPLNDLTHIQSVQWSDGIGFYTNELRKDSSTGELLSDFYVNKVYDYGLILEELTEKKIPTFYGIQPNPPLLIQNNFTVVQTNTHLTNTVEAEIIRDLHNNKIDLVSQISAIQNKVEKTSAKISKATFSSEAEKKAEQEILAKLNQTLVSKTISKNTINAEILVNKKNINKIKPTYAVRGIFPFPKAVMDKDGKTKPQEVVQFEIWIKRLSKSGDENQLQTFNDISKDVNLNKNKNLTAQDKVESNNIKNVNATFSNWTKIKTDARKQVFDAESGEYIWEIEDVSDANTPNINQVDIPIEPGEIIQIKIKSLSEVGYPEAPLESNFSEIITVEFPENLNSIINDDDFILNDATSDNTKSEMIKELETMGLTKHLSSQIRDVDVYYAHTSNAIASGFKDNNGKIINLYDYLLSLRNELIAIKEEVNRSKGILEIFLVKGNNKRRIYNSDNILLSIQLEDYMVPTQIGIAGSGKNGIARTYKNEVIKISDYSIEIKNTAESAILGLLSNRGYGNPPGQYASNFAYNNNNTNQVIYVNSEDEIRNGKINASVASTTDSDFDATPRIATQLDNSFIWQQSVSMEGKNIADDSTVYNTALENINIKNDATYLSTTAIDTVTSLYQNIGNKGSCSTDNTSNIDVMTRSEIFTYAHQVKSAQASNRERSLGTTIHAVVSDLDVLKDDSQQKVKHVAPGDDGTIKIPISIYAKPFTGSKNTYQDTTTSEVDLTTFDIDATYSASGTGFNIIDTNITKLLENLQSPYDVKKIKIVLTDLNTGDPLFDAQVNNIPLNISSFTPGVPGFPSIIKINKQISSSATGFGCKVAQIHILNINQFSPGVPPTAPTNFGGNGSNPMRCYNVYNVGSYTSIVDSYIEIPSTSIPVEHTKSLRFQLEDENNIRPFDFQLSFKITQHKRAQYTTGVAQQANVSLQLLGG